MARWATVGGWIGAILLLGGCAHTSYQRHPVPDGPYKVGCADVLDVFVWHDPEVSREVPVRPDGFISLPIAGEVHAAGKTPVELADAIKKKLIPYVKDPNVVVMVKQVNSSRIFVSGEVTHPGVYPLTGRTSVVQAIALAGGFTDFADKGDILILSPGDAHRMEVAYGDLLGTGAKPVYLRSGDTVVVR